MTDPTIGQRLRQIRKDEKLTQQEFADLCGSNQTTIARIEKGEREITIDIILNLCKKLSYHSDYILLGDLPKKRTAKDGKG